MKELTNKELAAIESLKGKISDIYEEMDDFHRHDLSLLRFLRARDLNVEKAEDMLRKNVIWRKENNLDKIVSKEISPAMIKRYPFKLCGFDNEGSCITICPAGKYDYRAIIENNEKEEFLEYNLKNNEMWYELFKTKSTEEQHVNSAIAIMDYEGFSIRQFMSPATMSYMKEMTVMFEANYPEILKTAIIINAPKVFEVLYNMMKPILTKAMIAKIKVYGSNSTVWKEVLLKAVPADQLPSEYGGANTTSRNYSYDMGLDVTPKITILPEADMTTEVVPAGQKFTVDIPIESANMTLHWNFKTEDYDIGFHVYLEDEIDEPIVSISKCDAHVHVQKGTLVCKKPGTYTLSFDNSYSSFRSKTLQYVTRVDPAEPLTS